MGRKPSFGYRSCPWANLTLQSYKTMCLKVKSKMKRKIRWAKYIRNRKIEFETLVQFKFKERRKDLDFKGPNLNDWNFFRLIQWNRIYSKDLFGRKSNTLVHTSLRTWVQNNDEVAFKLRSNKLFKSRWMMADIT